MINPINDPIFISQYKNPKTSDEEAIELINNGTKNPDDFGPDFNSRYQDALTTVTQSGHNLASIENIFKNNRAIVLAAVRQNGWALQYASESLKDDGEIVLAAVIDKMVVCSNVQAKALKIIER